MKIEIESNENEKIFNIIQDDLIELFNLYIKDIIYNYPEVNPFIEINKIINIDNDENLNIKLYDLNYEQCDNVLEKMKDISRKYPNIYNEDRYLEEIINKIQKYYINLENNKVKINNIYNLINKIKGNNDIELKNEIN